MNDYDIFGLQPIFIITIFSSDEAILHLTKANFPPATWSSFKNIAKSLIKCLIDQKSQRPLFEGCKCICHYYCHCHCLFVVFLLKKVSEIALWRCSLNVFAIFIVIVFVFVFVVVFLLVRSCFLITLMKCVKCQKSQRSHFEGIR